MWHATGAHWISSCFQQRWSAFLFFDSSSSSSYGPFVMCVTATIDKWACLLGIDWWWSDRQCRRNPSMGAVGRSSGALIHWCVGKIAGYRQEKFPAVQRYTDSWSKSCTSTWHNDGKKPQTPTLLYQLKNCWGWIWERSLTNGSMLTKSIFRGQRVNNLIKAFWPWCTFSFNHLRLFKSVIYPKKCWLFNYLLWLQLKSINGERSSFPIRDFKPKKKSIPQFFFILNSVIVVTMSSNKFQFKIESFHFN